MLKILQGRLQQYVNHELPDVQAGFRKGRGTRDQIANIFWIIEKPREFQKNIYFCFIDYATAFDCVDHNKLSKILKEMGLPDTWPAFWETWMQVRKQQLELDMEQQTGSKLGKEYIKLYIVTLLILTYMQSTSCKMPGWMKHKLELIFLGEISITSDMQMTLYGRKWRRTKEALDESGIEEWISWLKSQHSENEHHGIWSHHFMGNRWGNSGNSVRLYFWGAPKSLHMVIAAMKLKDAYSLEGKLWPT